MAPLPTHSLLRPHALSRAFAIDLIQRVASGRGGVGVRQGMDDSAKSGGTIRRDVRFAQVSPLLANKHRAVTAMRRAK